MGTATGFNISILDVNDSQRVSRHNTTLVEAEAVLLLSHCFIHKGLIDVSGTKNYSISFVLDLQLHVLSKRSKVSYIEMCSIDSLFSTVLPDMWAEDATA